MMVRSRPSPHFHLCLFMWNATVQQSVGSANTGGPVAVSFLMGPGAARALTTTPREQALFIVGHGPNSAEDYAAWMENLRPVPTR